MLLAPNPGAIRAMRSTPLCSLLLLALAGCVGQPPPPQASAQPDPGPNPGAASCSQMGIASWYRGASRDRRSPRDLVAAHRSLPFGTKLRVTHGGRSVVVTINDRGPFIRSRVLDLSKGAARAIGLTGAGVGRVTAEVVS